MSTTLFRPFERFNFGDKVCFLTGLEASRQVQVFPEWMVARFNLEDKALKMLDEHILTYPDIKIPVSEKAFIELDKLETEVSTAFNLGYQVVKELDDLRLFQWIAKQVYGMIHHEVRAGMRQQRAAGEALNFSQGLMQKFGNLHLMLQSLVSPMEFEGVLPWKILVFPVDNPPAAFIYRDEINTLVFSLTMADFGIIACLQDNGENANYHQEVLNKVGAKTLQPIQFEELCARFFYSAYIFNRLPEYSLLSTGEMNYVDGMPLRISSRPVFDAWQTKTYGQVLETFWKPWGYVLFEIIKDPDHPMSFLLDQNGEFIINPRPSSASQHS
ncbi:hypothetical protein [Arcticibacter sp.]|uniref:hypothetical protein n=1 Tax=Arcticibacter sp. TaxID=1872630 RepID=UPI00388EEF65